jgi:hypothetical protein
MSDNEASSLRELLYRVIRHYDELAAAARKGETDPLGYVGRLVRRRFPYLLLVIRDLLPLLENNQLDYYEALFRVVRAAQSFGDYETVLDSKREIERIEEGHRVFAFALKWMDSRETGRPGEGELKEVQELLGRINDKCVKHFMAEGDGPKTAFASELTAQDGIADAAFQRTADLVRSAIQQIFHLTVDAKPRRSVAALFSDPVKDLRRDLNRLAWFLFRCGFPVDWIAQGYYKDLLSAVLNEEILDYLISTRKGTIELEMLSLHVALISLLDFANFFDMPSHYCDIENRREVSR